MSSRLQTCFHFLSVLQKIRYFELQQKYMKFYSFFWLVVVLVQSDRFGQTSLPQETSLDGVSTGRESYRALVYQKNNRFVDEHNANPASTYKLEAYPIFAAKTDEENKAKLFRTNLEDAFKQIKVEGHVAKPAQPKNVKGSSINVYLSGTLATPVINQGACGNGYAISVCDTVNMNYKLSGKNYPLLSFQQLTDCSNGVILLNSYNRGCIGGNTYISMQYIYQYGVSSINAYPQSFNSYAYGTQQPCARINAPKYRINNWWYFNDYSCFSRISYMQLGYAISVTVTGGNPYFWYYRSGILPQCYGTLVLDHAVVMVGAYVDYSNLWGSYVILKNSFGVYWGEGGNIRVSLGGNVCLACIYGAFTT